MREARQRLTRQASNLLLRDRKPPGNSATRDDAAGEALSDKICQSVVQAMQAPEVKKGMALQATEIVIRGPVEFREIVSASMVKNEKLVKSLQLRPSHLRVRQDAREAASPLLFWPGSVARKRRPAWYRLHPAGNGRPRSRAEEERGYRAAGLQNQN